MLKPEKTLTWEEKERKPENEYSADLDLNEGKSVKELGYHADDKDFYEPGDSERKNIWDRAVTHQDSETFPECN